MAKTPAVGASAPDIHLPDQDGKTQKLAAQRGKWVLVYFYPRDDTPGCTLEACGVRDAWSAFGKAGITVFGISADSTKSHAKFANKFRLPFTLLADEKKTVVEAYGAWGKKKFMGREFDGILRQSFLVDPKGKIAKVYPKVKPEAHAAEVLADVAALSAGAKAKPKAKPKPKSKAEAVKSVIPMAKKVAKAPAKSSAKVAKAPTKKA
ncbi:MAG: thioredoxin-dependent thiol peroxidase [Planctomycetes bacterium]|nr:thioredoxin-dependent thiol peroxidase [Planctomycetota bacterium]